MPEMPSEFTREELIDAIKNVTAEVFETMLGLEVRAGEAHQEQNVPGPSEGIVGVIGLTGPWLGTGMFHCSSLLGCKVASSMMMAEYPGVSDEVLDAVGEITNMLFGNVKTFLEGRLGPMGLSIPSVIFGRNFSSRTLSKNVWTVIPFQVGADTMEIQLCLTLNRAPERVSRPNFVRAVQLHTPEMTGAPTQ
jgi:chemotaxis protein CheX